MHYAFYLDSTEKENYNDIKPKNIVCVCVYTNYLIMRLPKQASVHNTVYDILKVSAYILSLMICFQFPLALA